MRIRKRAGIPQDGFLVEKDSREWYEKLFKNKTRLFFYNQVIQRLTAEFKLGPNFRLSIETFLVFNKIIVPDSLQISMNYNETIDQMELRVQVFGETRESDWSKAWPRIKKLQKKLPGYRAGRFTPKTNLPAEKLVYDMSMAGASYNEIDEKLKKNKLGTHSDLNKLISNFKKRLRRFD